jgi:AN1-type zinc finger protein 1
MAASRTPEPPEESYSKMSVGDVEAVGSQCQEPFCRQLDFLPFKCESCQG